ncbi:MAG TPA: hypothetical protein VF759_06010 [Allosphingosinicella sp.]|jgi:hypothetical protein
MKVSRLAAAAAAASLLPAGAGAGGEPAPLCNVGYSVPRVTADALAEVSDVAIVDVGEVAVVGLECRVKGVVRAVERGSLYAPGQALDFRLNCAGEGATLRHPNSPWLYSDVPIAGQPGLLHNDMRFGPPGPHFLNIRPAGSPKVAASASGQSRSLC